jgi:LysR family transcriptional regulator, transcriptional activator of the cysJI operon
MREVSDQAFAAIAETTGEQAGDLAIGASQTIGQYLLPNFVAGFVKAYPRIRIIARSGNTEAMLDALLAHRIQLALIEGPDRRKDLNIEPFFQDHMVLVVPPSHEWADQEIDVKVLKQQPLLMREFGSGSRRVVEKAIVAAGLQKKDLKIQMELDSTEGLLSAVEAGLGVTFVSRWAVRNQLSLGTLKIARVRGLKLARQFSIAYPAGPAPAGNVGAFHRFLLSNSLELAPRPTGKHPFVRTAR